jgi:hypothetical protein
MRVFGRPIERRYSSWHPHVSGTTHGQLQRGGAVTLTGPGFPGTIGIGDLPNLPGRNIWFNGMDPSDPTTWIRPYRPAPGMISYLNLDGARPNPAGGVQRGKQPPLMGWGRGGVAGSSVNNG